MPAFRFPSPGLWEARLLHQFAGGHEPVELFKKQDMEQEGNQTPDDAKKAEGAEKNQNPEALKGPDHAGLQALVGERVDSAANKAKALEKTTKDVPDRKKELQKAVTEQREVQFLANKETQKAKMVNEAADLAVLNIGGKTETMQTQAPRISVASQQPEPVKADSSAEQQTASADKNAQVTEEARKQEVGNTERQTA